MLILKTVVSTYSVMLKNVYGLMSDMTLSLPNPTFTCNNIIFCSSELEEQAKILVNHMRQLCMGIKWEVQIYYIKI